MTFAAQRFLLGAMASEAGPVPVPGLVAVYVVHSVRTWAYFYRRFQRLQRPSLMDYVVGAAMNQLLGNDAIYKIVSRVADVALCTLEGVEALLQLKRDCSIFRALVIRERQVPVPLRLDDTYFNSSFFSASSVIALSEMRREIQKRALLITDCFLNILVSLRDVSVALFAAQDALEGHFLQGVETYYNAKQLYAKLSSDKAQRICNQILQGLGFTKSLEQYVPKPA